ncbi:MAG TPA: DUF4331 domain-containing protein [Kofleriaceae bacterium]|nr:DUF4331 domain-containing protein [Kofleriaceae bacterium]
MKTIRKTHAAVLAIAGGFTLNAFQPATASASSHREAPAIGEDQFADNTDVYTFISPENPDKLVIVANYVPLLIPSSGPNFYKFSDNVAYDLHIDNDGDARDDLVIRYLFKTSVQNGDTFLYNTGAVASLDDPNLNVRQVYDVILIDKKTGREDALAADVPVAPWYVGDRSFPGGSYEGVALSAIASAGGSRFFAGPRDEPFFVDLHVFDLLGVGGAPTTNGVNVMSLVTEMPIAKLAYGGARPGASAPAKQKVLGVHATASRQRTRLLHRDTPERNVGGWVQVSRLGWPLVNEVLIPLKDKDKYNRSRPQQDVANFGSYILFPELPGLLTAVLGANCAATPDGGRTDLVGLLAANGTTPADLQRIDVSAGQTFENSSFPNGRWLEDDVFDIEATVLCNNGGAISDGVNANDLPFTLTFPFLASPFSGNPL